MKHNTLKKILSLLLVICMMASFAGCIPGEEDLTNPSIIETTGPAESTAGPTEGTTAPTDSTDDAISTVNDRSVPSTDDMTVGSLSYGKSVQRTGIGNKG